MTEPTTDPRHPLADLPGIIGRLPRYLVLGRELLRDPRLARRRKAAIAGGIAYVAMPLDLVPGFIPVAGQLDDLAALLLSLRYALGGCPPATRLTHLEAAGLAPDDLARDLAAVQRAGGWIAGRVGAAAGAAGRISMAGAGMAIRAGARIGRGIAGTLTDRAR